MPIPSMSRPWAAKKIGKIPQDMPSLRLLTRPAWHAAKSVRSPQLVRAKIARNVGSELGEAAAFAGRSSCVYARVSRTSSHDSSNPSTCQEGVFVRNVLGFVLTIRKPAGQASIESLMCQVDFCAPPAALLVGSAPWVDSVDHRFHGLGSPTAVMPARGGSTADTTP